MSVCSALVNHQRREIFNLGKEWWGQFLDDDEDKPLWMLDKTHLLECVVKTYVCNPYVTAGYILWMRDQIWEFVQGAADTDLEVLTDSAHGSEWYDLEKNKGYKTRTYQVSEKSLEDYLLEHY